MQDREPTIRSRELGLHLRRAMEDAGLSGIELAERLGWSASRVSRLLSGKRWATDVDVAAFLAHCRITGGLRRYLLGLCRDAGLLSWRRTTEPDEFGMLLDIAREAVDTRTVALCTVPPALRTPAYHEALQHQAGNEPFELPPWNTPGGPRNARFAFFVHERALSLPVGGPGVMLGQLRELRQLLDRSCLSIRVIPTARGPHPGVNTSFTLFRSPELHAVVRITTATCALYLEQPDEVHAYQRILTALDHTALPETATHEFLAHLTTQHHNRLGATV